MIDTGLLLLNYLESLNVIPNADYHLNFRPNEHQNKTFISVVETQSTYTSPKIDNQELGFQIIMQLPSRQSFIETKDLLEKFLLGYHGDMNVVGVFVNDVKYTSDFILLYEYEDGNKLYSLNLLMDLQKDTSNVWRT